jgi:hypothetical protein
MALVSQRSLRSASQAKGMFHVSSVKERNTCIKKKTHSESMLEFPKSGGMLALFDPVIDLMKL